MKIAGIQKFSVIDFPGKTCCIIFTPGCNLRCRYCHNKNLVIPSLIKENTKSFISKEDFFNFLDTRIGLLDGVSICGGEPTLQTGLIEFCKELKNKGFLVKLDTNGVNPDILEKLLLENLLDYIAMDIKSSLENYHILTQVKDDYKKYEKSIKIIMSSNIDYEFRTTLCKGYHDENEIISIYKLIKGAKNFYLQNYRKGEDLEESFDGRSFTNNELAYFKSLGEKYLDNIKIRN